MKLLLSTAVTVCSLAVQFTLAQSPLTTYVESVRQGSYAPVPSAILNDTARASQYLQALPTYQTDTLTTVRSRAYNIAARLGQRSSDPTVRQTAVGQLIGGIGDADRGISGNNTAALTRFRREDFTAEAQDQLLSYLQPTTPHLDQVAMLAGFVQPPGVQAALQALLGEKLSATTRWAVQLARARSGDEVATNYILSRLASAPVNDVLVYELVPGLIYTRQSAVFDYLQKLILSDVPNCQSADPDSQQKILCGYRVMEALAPALTDFPVAVDQYGELLADDYEQALERVRDWLREQTTWPMRTEVY